MDSESADPGTLRPGGRTARVRAAVLSAAGDALAEGGFARLDLADVARRAEVGKTTVYRRWGTVTGLVADLLEDMAEQSLPRTETGSLLGDLKANAELVRRTLADPRQGALFKAVIAAATCDTQNRRRPCTASTTSASGNGHPACSRPPSGARCRRAPTRTRSFGPYPRRSTTSSSPHTCRSTRPTRSGPLRQPSRRHGPACTSGTYGPDDTRGACARGRQHAECLCAEQLARGALVRGRWHAG